MNAEPKGLGLALVTGATGFIGGHLALALAKQGRAVRALVRASADDRALRQAGVEIATGDLLDPESLARAVEGAATVFHCAAVIGEGRDAAESERILRVNVEGTGNLLAAAEGRSRRFVFLSSIAVYGPDDLDAATEDAPLIPAGPYSKSKIEGERLVSLHAGKGRFDAVILRPCQVYGPGDKSFLPRILRLLDDPDVLLLGNPSTVVDLVHVSDVVQAALLAEATAAAAGRAYTITDGSRTTLAELLSMLSAPSRARRRIHDVSPRHARAFTRAAWVARVVRSLGRNTRRLHPVAIRDLTRHRHFDVTRARIELSYRPAVSLEAGLQELLRRGGGAASAR